MAREPCEEAVVNLRSIGHLTLRPIAAGRQTYGPYVDRSIGAMLLFEKAHQIGFSGIGLNQKGPHHKRFVHVYTLKRKALWSY